MQTIYGSNAVGLVCTWSLLFLEDIHAIRADIAFAFALAKFFAAALPHFAASAAAAGRQFQLLWYNLWCVLLRQGPANVTNIVNLSVSLVAMYASKARARLFCHRRGLMQSPACLAILTSFKCRIHYTTSCALCLQWMVDQDQFSFIEKLLLHNRETIEQCKVISVSTSCIECKHL